MIIFLILSLVFGIINCLALLYIEKLNGYSFISLKTGERISIFSSGTPIIAKVFIALQFIPVLNIVFIVLLIIDYFVGDLK